MASRRLSIVDLSDAALQPMGSPDGLTWLAYNGEIYNFKELRRELQQLGRSFRTDGDTEVLLAAYERWGLGCLERLEGMWAFVVLDLRKRVLAGSRDRIGIKPLHWMLNAGTLLLASEARQILAVLPARPAVDARLVASYLRGNRYPCLEDTFFAGIRQLPPATMFELSIDAGAPSRLAFRPYWSLARATSVENPPSYPEARQGFRELLAATVDSHADADVTVGALLSGGLDSSMLASLLAERARRSGRPAPTFSFGLGTLAPELCELRHAHALVRQDGLENHVALLEPGWVAASLGRVIRALEEPPMGLPALAQYRIFERCAEAGVRVVLDGEGADEALGGYPYNQRTLLLDRLLRGRLVDFARELGAIARHEPRPVRELLQQYFLAPAGRRLARRAHAWLDPAYGRAADGPPPDLDASADRSRLNRELYFQVRWGNLKIVLNYTDRSAMAHSIEARVPYVDRRLLEFAFSLPDHYKVGRGERKRILRDVCRERLPPEITERRDRMGFGTPDHMLLRGALKPALVEAVAEPSFSRQPCFRPGRLEPFVAGYLRGSHEDARSVFRILALATWCREFGMQLS